ncbi:MAG: G/U mismatch-specific DNA glycosylase [Myxococcota bacterium]|nr:G/U mismatch-specific DNA glycosylase [Deltaproteobacteria bacterium]MDQ3338555.1 G/U mismatch-specific DNA glycosylase [Myxococcota bacterium]
MARSKTKSKPASKNPTSKAKPKPDPVPPADGSAWRPNKKQLEAARKKKVPDLLAPNLTVLFCGINPGLYSAAVGHHFAGPGNLLWPTLLASGFTPRLFNAFDANELLAMGFGITNFVPRTTASADELDHDELHAGARAVSRKVRKWRPKWVAFLGLHAYRIAFERRKAIVGLQPETIGTTKIWLLPNPSGLNAFHQPAILNQMFSEFRQALPEQLPSFELVDPSASQVGELGRE